ncbi:butyrophilin subfamily 2 member A1 [Nothobranchius furzeri]|uniref:Butyrophilin subfamily 3 member A2-like n=1 Tax=Nothobranchius furzeri TaxID=105023 RepID=A0A1A8AIM6_NOTFU|nr:butyrophilin subfamily 3 member A2-like [Nothobranchius furzeri]
MGLNQLVTRFSLLSVLGLFSFKAYPTAHAEPVVASAGQSVILPCSVKISATDDIQTVEWSKKDLKPVVVFLYRDGCETFEMKDRDFEYRTSLIMREMKNGNVSLRISNVKLSDAGTYRCLKILKNGTREESSVELVVVAASDPKLALLPADTRGVTVECEARCWWPSPQVMIQDENGNNITDEEPRVERTRGCFSVKHRVTLLKRTSRVVCRVHQPTVNQSRTAEIFIPDMWMCDSSTTYVCGTGTALAICIVVVGTVLLLRKRCCRSETMKVSDSSGSFKAPESLNLLSSADETMESQKEEVADLKLENRRKDQIICDLRKQISSQQLFPLLQHNPPTMIQTSSTFSLDSPHQPLDPHTDPRTPPGDHKPTQTASKPQKAVKSPQKNSLKHGNQKQNNPRTQTHSRNSSSSLAPPDSPVSDQSNTHVRIRSVSESQSHNAGISPLDRPSSLPSYRNRFSPLKNAGGEM